MKRVFFLLMLLLAGGPVFAGDFADVSFYDSPRQLPQGSFADAHGAKVTLDSFKGQLVVLDFWATWCGPCRQEFPALDRLQERLGAKGVTVVPVSVDRKGMPAVDRFYTETKPVHLARYLDDDHQFAEAMGIRVLPTTLIIDPQGGEIARVEGPADWDSPWFDKELVKRSGK